MSHPEQQYEEGARAGGADLIVQGFSTPPLLLLIMLIIGNNRKIMGDKVNTPIMNVLGWTTTAAIFCASIGLVATWLI